MTDPRAAALPHFGRRILIADDSSTQRLMLKAQLRKFGCEVIEARDGDEALARLREHRVPLVISDWMMPGLIGPDLCRAIREAEAGDDSNYTYVILLTSKQDKDDVSEGLSAGADDFLSKPVDPSELDARLKAGFRVVDTQARLVKQKLRIGQAFEELKTLYERIEQDLHAASLLQREAVPPAYDHCNGCAMATFYRPAGHVGGDLVGYFPIGETGLGAYSIDVSGHGVASSLLTVRLAQLFSPHDRHANVAFAHDSEGLSHIRDPAEVVKELNERCLGGEGNDLYFTIALAIIDLESGIGKLCQAGHTPPAVLRAFGGVDFIGKGGPPVGLLPGMEYETEQFHLGPGARLLLYSDGIVEAPRRDGSMIEESGLASLLRDHRDIAARTLLPTLLARIGTETGRGIFDDDVSALLLERPACAQDGSRDSRVSKLSSDPISMDRRAARAEADGTSPA